MRLSLRILLVLALAVLVAFLFRAFPGAISVAFGPYLVELPVWLGALALALLLLVAMWAARLLMRMRWRLSRRGAARAEARRAAGDGAIVSALAALAAVPPWRSGRRPPGPRRSCSTMPPAAATGPGRLLSCPRRARERRRRGAGPCFCSAPLPRSRT